MERPILNINIDLEAYFKHDVLNIINHISGNEQANWGLMTPHHVLEHLALVLTFPLEKIKIQLITPEDKLEKNRQFLLSEYGMMQGFKFPLLPKDKAPELMTKNIEEAKIILKETIQAFLEKINDPNFKTALHPIFGQLNKNEWLIFQFKHFTHHFMQLGLV
jgi:oxepin-CoA hydrolase/3-oxo-5,6-dehydrosuberyl-CoA semialdehyde dehydrogenase